jgi:hypothetical protein
MRFRVVWGRGDTMATFVPTNLFNNVDFPVLGRPNMTAKPDLKGVVASDMILSAKRET